MGGGALAEAGLVRVVGLEAGNVMGGLEVGVRLGAVVRAFEVLKADARLHRPDVALLVDYAEFNLLLAGHLKRRGIRVVFLASPQVWAWRRGRIRRIARVVDRMLVLFPFEQVLYRRCGVPVAFVGHPVVEEALRWGERPACAGGTTVALVPGSRPAEVEALLPPMLEAGEWLRERFPDVRFVVARAPTIDPGRVEAICGRARIQVDVSGAGVPAVVSESRVALVTSGTATLEVAALGVPMVILYRTSWPTYLAGRLLVRDLVGIGMVNILAGRRVVPEQVQRVTPARVAAQLAAYLERPTYAAMTGEALRGVAAALGGGGAAERAAREVAQELAEARADGEGDAAFGRSGG